MRRLVSVQPIEGVSELGVDGREQVAVAIESGLDRRVAESFHDRPRVRALRDEQRRARVPQIVEPEALRDTRSPHRRLEVAAVEGVVPHRPTALTREHQVVLPERPRPDVLGELAGERLGDADLAARVGLGLDEEQLPADLAEGLDDVESALVEIDPAYAECLQLTGTQTGVRGGLDE